MFSTFVLVLLQLNNSTLSSGGFVLPPGPPGIAQPVPADVNSGISLPGPPNLSVAHHAHSSEFYFFP